MPVDFNNARFSTSDLLTMFAMLALALTFSISTQREGLVRIDNYQHGCFSSLVVATALAVTRCQKSRDVFGLAVASCMGGLAWGVFILPVAFFLQASCAAAWLWIFIFSMGFTIGHGFMQMFRRRTISGVFYLMLAAVVWFSANVKF